MKKQLQIAFQYRKKFIKIFNGLFGMLVAFSFVFSIAGCATEKMSLYTILSPADFSVAATPAVPTYYAATRLSISTEDGDGRTIPLFMTICGDQLAVLQRFIPNDVNAPVQLFIAMYNSVGEQTESFVLPETTSSRYISEFRSDKEGNIVFVEKNASGNVVTRLSASGDSIGEEVALVLPMDTENGYRFFIDQHTNYYIYANGSEGSEICVYDKNGQLLYTIADEGFTGNVFELGDGIFFEGNKVDSLECVYSPFDVATGNMGNPVDVSDVLLNARVAYNNGYFYSIDQTGISLFDTATKEKRCLVTWNDCNLDSRFFDRYSQYMILNEDVIFCMDENESGDMIIDVLNRQDENPNEGKKTLVLGGFFIAEDTAFKGFVQAFNESSQDYKVEIKDYYADVYNFSGDEFQVALDAAQQQMNLDILSGDAPDLMIFGRDQFVSSEKAGLLVDLMSFVSEDADFSLNDYIPNVVDASMTGDKLYKMPMSISYLSGLAGYVSVIGEQSGWTVDEYTKMAESLQDGVYSIGSYSQSDLLSEALSVSLPDYIDESTNQVRFATANFYQLLTWAKTYGLDDETFETAESNTDYLTLKEDGQLALWNSTVISPDYDFSIEVNPKKPISFVGFPSPSRWGPSIVSDYWIGIPTCSRYPDGAWEAVKFLLSEDVQDDFVANYYAPVPVLLSSFDEMIDSNIHPGYYEWVLPEELGVEDIQAISEEAAQTYRDFFYSANTIYAPDYEVLKIILEESPAYFNDQKSVEDVSAIIQNRVQILVDERGGLN